MWPTGPSAVADPSPVGPAGRGSLRADQHGVAPATRVPCRSPIWQRTDLRAAPWRVRPPHHVRKPRRQCLSLFKGYRRLRRTTLARLLQRHRGVRNLKDLPRLRIKDIVRWADAHFARTGQWPTHRSGPVLEAPGETWAGINTALQRGLRKLPGGSSLYRVLWKYRGVDRAARNATRARSA